MGKNSGGARFRGTWGANARVALQLGLRPPLLSIMLVVYE